MRRLALAVVVLLALAAPASGYEHLSQHAAVSGVQASHWASLPINLTVDGGPTDVLGEIQTAVDTWNAVPTARDPFVRPTARSATDFDETNLGTAWGNLTGDGSQEAVVDETGAALTALGFAPEAVNGFGPRHEFVRSRASPASTAAPRARTRSTACRPATTSCSSSRSPATTRCWAGWR